MCVYVCMNERERERAWMCTVHGYVQIYTRILLAAACAHVDGIHRHYVWAAKYIHVNAIYHVFTQLNVFIFQGNAHGSLGVRFFFFFFIIFCSFLLRFGRRFPIVCVFARAVIRARTYTQAHTCWTNETIAGSGQHIITHAIYSIFTRTRERTQINSKAMTNWGTRMIVSWTESSLYQLSSEMF